MKINFLPESDFQDFNDAVKKYRDIWNEDGNKIISAWERNTGLNFNEKEINAVVFDGISHSHPLSLRFNVEENTKKSILIHELGHRILYKRVKGMGKATKLDRHKFLFLILYDVFTELYGESFTKEAIVWDSNLNSDNKVAWDWILKFDTLTRKKIFNEILKGENFELIFKR